MSGNLNGRRDFKMKCFWILVICLFLSSCAHTKSKDYPRQDMKEILQQRANLYAKKNKDKFFGHISEQYYPNYKEFRYQVEDFLYSHSNIQLDFSIEKILEMGQRKSVEVKWFKTYVDRQGNPTKREGFATLIFDVSGDRPMLVNIKGDNPFIQ